MSHGKNHDLRRKFLIHDAEGKLPEGIFSKIGDVNWPALRSFHDLSYGLIKGTFELDCRNEAAFSIPGECCQIFLFRLRMKSKRITCHAAMYAPCAGLLPKRQSPPRHIELDAGGARPPAARQHQRPDRRSRPDWRSNSQPVPPFHSQAGPWLFVAVPVLLRS